MDLNDNILIPKPRLKITADDKEFQYWFSTLNTITEDTLKIFFNITQDSAEKLMEKLIKYNAVEKSEEKYKITSLTELSKICDILDYTLNFRCNLIYEGSEDIDSICENIEPF